MSKKYSTRNLGAIWNTPAPGGIWSGPRDIGTIPTPTAYAPPPLAQSAPASYVPPTNTYMPPAVQTVAPPSPVKVPGGPTQGSGLNVSFTDGDPASTGLDLVNGGVKSKILDTSAPPIAQNAPGFPWWILLLGVGLYAMHDKGKHHANT